MKIYLATCDSLRDGNADDQILAKSLLDLGHAPEFKVWNDPAVDWSNADHTIIRSTWDYQRDLPSFLKWTASTPNLMNDHETVKANCDKRYLAATPHAVKTRFAENERELVRALADMHDRELIVKPSVSASAELTFKTNSVNEARDAGLEILAKRGTVLIQPFIESIATNGEISLVYFNNTFSHAVVKRPKAGDFRVQQNFGGTVDVFTPTETQLAIAQAALPKTNYARVDLVDYATEPKIGELELIEPELFFRTNAEAAKRATLAFTDGSL